MMSGVNLEEQIILPSGEKVLIRALHQDDGKLLGQYFQSLSQETQDRFAPHPFTEEEAQKLCTQVGQGDALRFVAITQGASRIQVVAYFILLLGLGKGDRKRYEDRGAEVLADKVCSVAPSVADAYQGSGLARPFMEFIKKYARKLNLEQMVLMGGVQERNVRAIRFYEKCGFQKVARFVTSMGNYDMLLNLDASG